MGKERSCQWSGNRRYTTFEVGGQLYGCDVHKVQEVVRPLHTTSVPLAPLHISGLINLRGQVATAVSMTELFGISSAGGAPKMNVVCRLESVLVSLQVDSVGDVMELPVSQMEPVPATVSAGVQGLLEGVYRTPGGLLGVLSLPALSQSLGLAALRQLS